LNRCKSGFGKDSGSSRVAGVGFGNHRVSGSNRRGEIAASGGVKSKRKIIRAKDHNGAA
jgi:hypothetical protein